MTLNQLLRNDLKNIADYLHYTDKCVSDEQFKAILTNVCRKLASLDCRIDSLENATFNLEDKYIG